MTTPFRRSSLADYLTGMLAVFAVGAGIVLIIDRSLRTDVIQLRPAQHLFSLMWWGIIMVAAGAATVLRYHQPVVSRWGVRVIAVETAMLAVCNLAEAINLAQHPGPQLGWLGAVVWLFIAAAALGVATSNEQA